MKIDEVSFSDEFVKGFKNEKDFLEEMDSEGYKHIYKGHGRKEKLQEAFRQHKLPVSKQQSNEQGE